MVTGKLAEILGALSMATDMAAGQPPGTGLSATVLATRIGRLLGLDEPDLANRITQGRSSSTGWSTRGPGFATSHMPTASRQSPSHGACLFRKAFRGCSSKSTRAGMALTRSGPLARQFPSEPESSNSRLSPSCIGEPAALSKDEAREHMLAEAKAKRLPPDCVQAVLEFAGHERAGASALPDGLTPREVDVLIQIAKGNSNKGIADHLGVAPKTVDKRTENLYRKIGVRSRTAAALYAMERTPGHSGIAAPRYQR